MNGEKCFVILSGNEYGQTKVVKHTFCAQDAIDARNYFRKSPLYKHYKISVHTAKVFDGPDYGYGLVFDID